MRSFAILIVCMAAGSAAASPPPDDDDDEILWREDRAFLEWSTWIRLGYGVARTPIEAEAVPRSTQPPQLHDQHTAWDVALGADLTLPIPTSRVRLGPWLELRPRGFYTGAVLSIAGSDLDMFQYDGEHVYDVRVGWNMTEVTAALAWGYRCPWKLWGPYNSWTRYMIGVRLVAAATRSVIDPNDWSTSIGLEFEPIGSLRYLAAIQSWY